MRELAPKETGYEAKLQKRREAGNRVHGAHRDRSAAWLWSPGVRACLILRANAAIRCLRELHGDGEVSESISMGGGDPFLDKKLQRIRSRDAQRAGEQQERLRQHQ
eukprot:5329540-Alexandrium_andersonii.AAC.1